MTPQEIKTALEAKSDITTVFVGSHVSDNKTNIKRVTIDYRQNVGNEGVRRGKIQVETTDEVNYRFVGGKPSVLQESTPAPAPRDFHFPKTAVIAWFGNTGKTLLDEDEVSLSRDGKFDHVTARLIKTEGEAPNEVEIVTPVEYLIDKDAQGNAVVRQVK